MRKNNVLIEHGRLRAVLLGALLLVALAACGGSETDVMRIEQEIESVDASIGRTTEIACPLPLPGEVEGETAECGVFTVPLSYEDAAAGRLNLAYVVLKAENSAGSNDPIVFLAGGPGQSGILAANDDTYGDLRETRDLVFFAQRGTLFGHRLALEECVAYLGDQIGRSELEAFVDSVSNRVQPDRSLPYDEYLAAYSATVGQINERCYEAFANAGFDPTQFTTANSANDIVGLMDALGYDEYNLHGVSYGTRLALETLRRHPDAPIRSVVLDSVSLPSADRLVNLRGATHNMILRLFADCEADPSCNDAYPDLTQRTVGLLDSLDRDPIVVGDEAIGSADVVTQLSDLTNTRANYIPRMLAELERGETETYLALRDGTIGAASPEGPATTPAIDSLMQTVSAAGATPDDPFGGVAVVGAMLAATAQDNPVEAMQQAVADELEDSPALADVQQAIADLSADEVALLTELGAGVGEVDEDAAELLQNATARNNAQFMLSGMVCSEQVPFGDIDAAVALPDQLEIPALSSSDALLATEIGNCTRYPMGAVDPTYNAPVSSDVPVLILHGEFDVRTALANAFTLADQLENATLVVVPQAGHETMAGNNCAATVGREFLRDPQQALDTSCIDQRVERFSLPGDPLE